MIRKIIIVLIGVALLGGAFYWKGQLAATSKPKKPKIEKVKKTAFVSVVKNETLPLSLEANGKLEAKNKIDIFAEVQGVLLPTGKDFRKGVKYQKGETLLKVNSDELYATLQAQKSALQDLIIAIMPDLKLDHPASFSQWEDYLRQFNINQSVRPLPLPLTDQEKYFIAGKSINTTYYNIKNLEVKQGKYNILAPFTGILTEANVLEGALVRAGQKMGTLIDPSVYELSLSVNASQADVLKIGKQVDLQNIEKTKKWKGRVTRVNPIVDVNSQTIEVIVEVRGANLFSGMYLSADLPVQDVKEAIEIDRKLLVNNEGVYTIKDSSLDLVTVVPVHFKKNTVVVKGLEDGTQILTKSIPGAYDGMVVKVEIEK